MSKIAPFEHQAAALDDIRRSILPLGQVIMPCGTGKTYVAAWTAADYERVVFLAPSVAILKQAGRSWGKVGEEPTVYVCGDGEVGRNVTTDVDVLAKAIRDRSSWRVFGTYASAAKIAIVLREIGEADLIICDEAHHIAGREGKAWAHVLTEEFPGARRLFFTATQRTQRGKKRNALLVGMEDEEVFGPVVHELTYKDAIEQGLITDYRVEMVEVPAGGNDTKTKQEAAVHAAVKKAHDEGRVRCSIVMRHEVKQARESAALLTEMGMFAVVISGEDSAKEREDLAAKAVEERGVICACRALGEGVDIPGVDGVVFMDPKTSVVDIIQSIGRGMRLDYPGKVATIVVPFVVERGVDVEVDGALGHVLRALRETDERMEAAIVLTRDAKVTGGGLADDTVDFLRVKGLLAALEGPAGEAVLREAFGSADAAFDRLMLEAWAHVDRDGTIATCKDSDVAPSGYPLGSGLHNARNLWLKDAGRARRLRELPGWEDSPLLASRARLLNEYQAWNRAHGDWPRRRGASTSPEENRLATWALGLRNRQAKGDLSNEIAEWLNARCPEVLAPPPPPSAHDEAFRRFVTAVAADPGKDGPFYLSRVTDASLLKISTWGNVPKKAAASGLVATRGAKSDTRYFPASWTADQIDTAHRGMFGYDVELLLALRVVATLPAAARMIGCTTRSLEGPAKKVVALGYAERAKANGKAGQGVRWIYTLTPAGTAYLAEHNEPTEQAASPSGKSLLAKAVAEMLTGADHPTVPESGAEFESGMAKALAAAGDVVLFDGFSEPSEQAAK